MRPGKIGLLSLFFVFCNANAFTQNINIAVEITGVKINGGNIHVGVFTTERNHKRDIPFVTFSLDSTDGTLVYELELPEGECLIWGYQDTNNNGKLDTGFFGIPKEPIGLTNYNGKGIPGGFNKHKTPVNSSLRKISINLGVITL